LKKGKVLFSGWSRKSAGLDVVVNWIGSMGTLFFAKEAVTDFDSARKSDLQMFRSFYAGMLEQGIYLAPSAFEAWFVSAAHGLGSIRKTIQCAERSFGSLKKRKIH
jgi:glutamate-1-semialdehyde 2,1-aminomutase